MPEWLKMLLTGSGGGGFVAAALKLIDRRDARRDAAEQAAREAPHKDWELAEDIVGSAKQMLADVRAELDTWRDESRRLQSQLQEERAAFQTERKAMLDERNRWADERAALLEELHSERTQRGRLEGEVEQLNERVAKLEARLRDLGHDPASIV